jgi:hypothetical protein
MVDVPIIQSAFAVLMGSSSLPPPQALKVSTSNRPKAKKVDFFSKNIITLTVILIIDVSQ